MTYACMLCIRYMVPRLFCRSWLPIFWDLKVSQYALWLCQGLLSEVKWLLLRHFYVSTWVATHWGIIFSFCQDRNHYQFVMFSFTWQTILFTFLAELLCWHGIQQAFGYHSAAFYFSWKKKSGRGKERKEIWFYCKQCAWCLIIIPRFHSLARHLKCVIGRWSSSAW